MSESISSEAGAPHHRFNGSLWLGLALVLFVAALAVIGPKVAPRDPLEEKTIIQINDKWLIPPFPFFTPGYPLGSDHFGRDLYSRLLWGVRPTLVMVSIVAVVRLILGMVIGLFAGWSGGRLGRRLDVLIQGALAVPALLAALAAIAIVGVEIGVWAFVIGLSLTGWVETGQQVREQTRIIKGQVYIEAAQALGASNRQILIGHVLRQILPMTAMLFAFEVSSTLMTTAGLGFLGYYIGGDVWVEVGDFVSRRISGAPELGQMLATTWATLNEPWAMVATGSTVFLTVLGFNLLGEGFRQSLNLSAVRQRGIAARVSSNVRFAFEQYLAYPLSLFFGKQATRLAMGGALLFLLGGLFGFGLARWLDLGGAADFQLSQLFDFGQKPAEQTQNATPTAQPEARGNTTPTPTLAPPSYAPTPGSNPPLAPGVVWSYPITEAMRSGPEVVADGSIYFLTMEDEMHVVGADGNLARVIPLPAGPFVMEGSWGESYPLWPLILSDGSIVVISEKLTVYALDAQGNLLWETPLEAKPYRYPYRTENDEFYLTDSKGGLYAFDAGGLRWRFQTDAAPHSASAPAVAPDGVIYYTVTNYSNGFLQAVSARGEGLWATRTKTDMFYDEPQVSQDGGLVFVRDNVFDARTGEILNVNWPARVDELIFGMDGHLYLRNEYTVIQWQLGAGGIEILQKAEWGADTRGVAPPFYTVVDKKGVIWLTYRESIVWLEPDGTVVGVHRRAGSSGQIYLPDYENTLLTECNYYALEKALECATFAPQAEEPVWKVTVGGLPSYDYSFIQNGYAYVMGKDKTLYKAYLGEVGE